MKASPNTNMHILNLTIIRSPRRLACSRSDCRVYQNLICIYTDSLCMKDDLQLGKLKENCLLLKLYRKLRKIFLSPRREYISRLLFSSTCVALTNRCISWRSLCHLSPGSSMVRASHWTSEGCGFDSRLGLRNIFLSLR